MNGRGNQQGRAQEQPLVSAQELRAIIVDGDAEMMVRVAERVGKRLQREKLTTSQIRNFFGAVREIEMRWPHSEKEAIRQLLLLTPKLAYYVGKAKGDNKMSLTHLDETLRPCINLVQGDRERFSRFVDFFEAILAYHKYYGGD